jgi:HEAT repeat protein
LQEHHIGLSEEELISALRNPDGEVRSLAAAQLAAIEAQGAVPSIVDAMERETLPLTRIRIARALAQLGSEKGRDVLRANCINSAEPSFVRTEAAFYLLDISDGDGGCFNALVNMLESDKESDAKIQALSLLPRFKAVSEGDSIKVRGLCVRHLQDSKPAVRIAASQALVAFQYGAAIPDLQRAIAAEPDENVREQLKVALRQLEKNNQR